MKSTLGPAGNERSPQEIWKGGKVEVGQKKNTRNNHRYLFWQPTQLSISWSNLQVSICPPLLLSLTFPVCLRVTSDCGVCLCVQLRPSLHSEARWARLMKGLLLLFFPGKVIHWLSQESGQAANYFSRALFLLFHTQRQHNLIWTAPPAPPPLPSPALAVTRIQRRVQEHGIAAQHARHPSVAAFSRVRFTEKAWWFTKMATLGEAVSNGLCRAEGIF